MRSRVEPFHLLCVDIERNYLSDSIARLEYLILCPVSQGAGRHDAGAGRRGHALAGPFQAVYPFQSGLGIVVLSNRWGILGNNFQLKVDPKFDEIIFPIFGYLAGGAL
jgi:hypothetical protein